MIRAKKLSRFFAEILHKIEIYGKVFLQNGHFRGTCPINNAGFVMLFSLVPFAVWSIFMYVLIYSVLALLPSFVCIMHVPPVQIIFLHKNRYGIISSLLEKESTRIRK